jgi:NADH-quinone oxidoreductase subunit N
MAGVAGLGATRPWLATAIAIFMLSLAGLPPLFGFMPKLAVFNAAVGANLWLLAVVGVLASVVAAYYYLRLIKIMFFDPAAGPLAPSAGRTETVMLGAAAAFASPLGFLLLAPLAAASRLAATSLF